jgi:uncharacterized DUF497 family protein
MFSRSPSVKTEHGERVRAISLRSATEKEIERYGLKKK